MQAADAVFDADRLPGITPPPLVMDTRVQTLLSRAANIDAIFGDVTLTPADIEPVMTLCGKTDRVTVIYVMADVGLLKPPAGPGQDASRSRLIELQKSRNYVTYQDVIVPMLAFNVRCTARVLPLVTEAMTKLPAGQRTPDRMSELRRMRAGVSSTMRGAIIATGETDMSAGNRHLLVGAAADTVATFVALMPVADRKAIEQAAIHAKVMAATADQTSLDIIARAFADERCEGLCAFDRGGGYASGLEGSQPPGASAGMP
jgi:hypothetical protein